MRSPVILIILIALTSCSSAPPVPTDRFYKLSTPQIVNQSPVTEDIIYVGPFLAEGLYNERALLYTGDSGDTELQQHHYHFWVTSPPRLLQSQLVSYLRSVNSSSMITTEPGSGEKVSIFGRVKAFEKISSGEQARANVVLELRVQLQDKATPVLLKEYSILEDIKGNTVPDVVAAFDRAVMKVYSDFLGELQSSI